MPPQYRARKIVVDCSNTLRQKISPLAPKQTHWELPSKGIKISNSTERLLGCNHTTFAASAVVLIDLLDVQGYGEERFDQRLLTKRRAQFYYRLRPVDIEVTP